MSESIYIYTFIKGKTEKDKLMTSQKYIHTKDFILLRNWLNQEGQQIKPPDPDKPKTIEQQQYKYTFIKEKTENDNLMTSQIYAQTKDFTLLRDWLNQEGVQKQPPTPPTEEVPPLSDDSKTLAAMKDLLQQLQQVLSEEFMQNRYSTDDGNLNVEAFNKFLRRKLTLLPEGSTLDEFLSSRDLTLDDLFKDKISFEQELHAIMQKFKEDPYQFNEKYIGEAIKAILDEFHTITGKIRASGTPPSPPSDAVFDQETDEVPKPYIPQIVKNREDIIEILKKIYDEILKFLNEKNTQKDLLNESPDYKYARLEEFKSSIGNLIERLVLLNKELTPQILEEFLNINREGIKSKVELIEVEDSEENKEAIFQKMREIVMSQLLSDKDESVGTSEGTSVEDALLQVQAAAPAAAQAEAEASVLTRTPGENAVGIDTSVKVETQAGNPASVSERTPLEPDSSNVKVQLNSEPGSSKLDSIQKPQKDPNNTLSVEVRGLEESPEEVEKEGDEEERKVDEFSYLLANFEDSFENTSTIGELEEQIRLLKQNKGDFNDIVTQEKIDRLEQKVIVLKTNLKQRKELLRQAQLQILQLQTVKEKENATKELLTNLSPHAESVAEKIREQTKAAAAAEEEARKKANDMLSEQKEWAIKSAKTASQQAKQNEKNQDVLESEQFKKKFEEKFFIGEEFIEELKKVELGEDSEFETITGTRTSMPYKLLKFTLEDPELGSTREVTEKETGVPVDSKLSSEESSGVQQGGGIGILNEIEQKFTQQKAKATKLQREIDDIKKRLKEISDKHKPNDSEPSLISKKEMEEGENLLTKYYEKSSEYHTIYAIPLVYTKFINLFIFYISYYNKFKNSFLVKKLENLKNSEIYKTSGAIKGNIIKEFQDILKSIGLKNFLDIEDFFRYHFSLKSENFSNFIGFTRYLLVEKSDATQTSYLNFSMTDDTFKEGLTELFKKISNLNSTTEDLKIDNLNEILFYYASTRFSKITSALSEQGNSNKFFYVPDIKILGFMYFTVLRLSQYYKNEYLRNIERVLNNASNYEKLSNFFDKYNESSVISYIKIRDGQNEPNPKYQLFNPRYIYYSDRDYKTPGDNAGGLSLGLKPNSPSATLSLFYCNDPSARLKIPQYQENWLDIPAERHTPNDTVITALDYNELDNVNSNLFPKYDHLFHYGHFNKVLYNENNADFGKQMKEVIAKLEKQKDVFIIGYGASGAGKTTTLIYDKNELKPNKSGNPDGAVVFMLNQLAEKTNEFQEINLTICELFMAKPEVGAEDIDPATLYPKVIRKISNANFQFSNGSFKSTGLTFENYSKENISANNEDYQTHQEYGELFMKQGDKDTYNDEEDFPPGDNKKEVNFSLSKILQLLIDKKRKVSGTTNNPQSSRSHVLSIISFPKFKKEGKKDETVKLYIGDFAGVENKFDYEFDYGFSNNLEDFCIKVLNMIYDIASDTTKGTLEKTEQIEKFAPAHQLIKDLLSNHEELHGKLRKLENINLLITVIDMLNPSLFGKTIMDYAFLKHPKEKYPEVHDQKFGPNRLWKKLEPDEQKNFDNSDLVYFYQLLSEEENTDQQLIQKVKEMIPMIKFLGNKKFGYGDEYSATSKIKRFIESKSPNKFKPPPSTEPSKNEVHFLQKQQKNKDEKQGFKTKIDKIESEYGLIDVYQASNGPLPIKYHYKDNTFKIPHPGKNLTKSKRNIEELVRGIEISTKHEIGYNFIDLFNVKGSSWYGKSGTKIVMNHNVLFHLIAFDTLLDWFKGIETQGGTAIPRKQMTANGDRDKDATSITNGRGEEILFYGAPKNPDKINGGLIAGNFIESVEFYIDTEDEFKLKIIPGSLVPSNNLLAKNATNAFKSSLGLPTSIHNNPDLYNDNYEGYNFIINSAGKGSDAYILKAGDRVREAMIKLNEDKHKVARLIEKNFNTSYYPRVRKNLFAHFGTDPGGVNNYGASGKKYSLNDLQDLIKKQHFEMEKKKIKIKEETDKETDKLTKEVKRLDTENADLQKKIEKERGDKNQYTLIAEAVVKRIFYVHYEVIKRTYEGLFINKSLEQMRFTMTDVLKVTNQKNGESTSLVPNFNAKCTNYYSNVLIEDLFEEVPIEESSDETNRNRFNVIHQIMVQNKGIEAKELKEINQDAITSNLSSGLTYCVCLLLNNTYIETQNLSLVNNPPKIPYIDLTEAYTELSRYKARTKSIGQNEFDIKSLIFKKFYTHYEKETFITQPSKDLYLLCESLRTKIEEISGFTYEEFTNKQFNMHIFENLNTYMNYCYSVAITNNTIAAGKKNEILDRYYKLENAATMANINVDSLSMGKVEAVIKAAKDYLLLIEIMNGTSVIGTIDFADEISKYNLKYNKCSVTQFDIRYKSYNQLYSSNYDYLKRFRYMTDTKRPLSPLATGVHAFIPKNTEVISQVWKLFILPSLFKLSDSFSIYNGLIKNKLLPILLGKESRDEFRNYGIIKKQIVQINGTLKQEVVNSDQLKLPEIRQVPDSDDALLLQVTVGNDSFNLDLNKEIDLTQFMDTLKTLTTIDREDEIKKRIQIIKTQREFIKKLILIQDGTEHIKKVKEEINRLKQEERDSLIKLEETLKKIKIISNEHPNIPKLELFTEFKTIGEILDKNGKTMPEGTKGYLIDVNLESGNAEGNFLIIDFKKGGNEYEYESPIAHMFLKLENGSAYYMSSNSDEGVPNVILSKNFDDYIKFREKQKSKLLTDEQKQRLEQIVLSQKQPGRGGSKTRKKLKLMPAKKIESKYKQSLKNKVKVNYIQVNRENLLNESLNNKTKRHLRLKLKEKKNPIKKYKKSFKK
jgi:hypothetical protein